MYEIRIKKNSPVFVVKNKQITIKVANYGKRGPQGVAGETGPAGAAGQTGPGVPTGGSVGQYLRKASTNNFDLIWVNPASDEISDTGQTHKFVTAAQKTLIDSAIQPGANISELTNNAGYITNLSSFTTSNLAEGSNLYYTTARVQTVGDARYLQLSGGTLLGSLSINSSTGFIDLSSAATAAGINSVIKLSNRVAETYPSGFNKNGGAEFFNLVGAAANSSIFGSGVDTDAVRRYRIMADGKTEWGPGNGSRDTNLYRSAADVLKTDDSFIVGATLTIGTLSGMLKASTGVVSGSATTSDLTEGSNLYYTDERVDDRVASLMQNGTGITWTYNDVSNTLTPAVSLSSFSTSNLSEGSNLYYTDARVQTYGDTRYLQKTGGTMSGKIAFSGVSSDFAIDAGGFGIKDGSLIIAGSPQAFNWPFVMNGVQPAAFMYLDSTYNILRIGTQKPSSYNAIAFELPNNNEYQDVFAISTSAINPSSALSGSLDLGATGGRWGNVYLGANKKITGTSGLTLEETGDTYGTVRLYLQNRNGVNGAMFEQAGSVDLVDFVFKGLSNQANIRYENRGSSNNYGSTPEFQIGSPGSPWFTIGGSQNYSIQPLRIQSLSGVLKASTGVVSGGATTSDLTEGSNLYYTDERVDDRVSALIQNGTGISWSYNDGAGTLTPAVSLSAFSTSNLSEGSNLYYTDERVDDRVAALLVAGAGIALTYNDAGNALTIANELTPAPGADTTASGAKATLTAAENLVFGDVVYINSSGKMAKADADAIATSTALFMALGTISTDASGSFAMPGSFVRNDAWNWTVGGVIYLSGTAGSLTQTAPTATNAVVQIMGVATHADRMFFYPQLVQIELN